MRRLAVPLLMILATIAIAAVALLVAKEGVVSIPSEIRDDAPDAGVDLEPVRLIKVDGQTCWPDGIPLIGGGE